MKKFLFTLLASACIGFYSSAVFAAHSMHPLKQIAFVKKQIKQKNEPYYMAYLQLIHYADSIQGVENHALEDYSVPGYYVKPAEHIANSKALQRDAFGAYCSALAYKLTGKKKYGQKACYFMNAWANINKKYSDPDGPLVMSYSGNAMMIAAELMNDSKLWSDKDKEAFKDWVTSVYQKACNEIRERANNWADWGRFGSLLAASFLEDKAEVTHNVDLIKSDIAKKILPDGHMPFETQRGANGVWYTYFSLAPMTASMWVIYNLTGENLFIWENNGATIKKALDYLLYYRQHPDEWSWFKDPNISKTHTRWPDNLLEAMFGIYHEQAYFNFVKDSRPHIYPEHHFAWSFPTLMPISLEGWK